LLRRPLIAILALVLFSPVAHAADKPVRIRVSSVGGFDDNRSLNSERKSDFFTQQTASVSWARLLQSKAKARLSWNALNLNYFEATDLNLFLNEFGAGLDILIDRDLVWENVYTFQYLLFPNNEAVTSYENEILTGLRKKMSDKWTLRANVSFSAREYEDKKKRSATRADLDDERADDRVQGEISSIHKVRKDLVFTLAVAGSETDSNDEFQNYYDYDAWKFSAGFSWQIDEKWLAFSKFSFEERQYDVRQLRDDSSSQQEDQLYTSTLSVYYKIDQNLSLGSILTYREKNSNEPSQQYSGSIGTLGLYYAF
jgi:hypothetical protein